MAQSPAPSSVAPALHGPSPPFFDAPGIDQVVHMVLAVAAELTAVSEQLDTLRQVIAAKGVVTAEDFARYVPSATVTAARAARRGEFVGMMLGGLEADASALGLAVQAGAAARGVTR